MFVLIVYYRFQTQKRIQGALTLNPEKLQLPGGYDSNSKPRISTLEFLIDGKRGDRFYTSHQATVDDDLLKFYYLGQSVFLYSILAFITLSV